MRDGAKDMIDPIIQKTGEIYPAWRSVEVSGSVLGTYVHNNKTAIIVSLEGGSSELAKDLAMHITAMKPEYINPVEITTDTRKMMTEVFEKEVAAIDKPAEIKKKMLDGKINTYFKEKNPHGATFH